jgi:predicted DNA-binding protein
MDRKMLTIRLDNKTEQEINAMAKQLNMTKSELVRECIAEYMVNFNKPSAWELGANLFGKHASGQHNRAKDRKQLLSAIIKDKTCKTS